MRYILQRKSDGAYLGPGRVGRTTGTRAYTALRHLAHRYKKRDDAEAVLRPDEIILMIDK